MNILNYEQRTSIEWCASRWMTYELVVTYSAYVNVAVYPEALFTHNTLSCRYIYS
jgi:hypothetical protein